MKFILSAGPSCTGCRTCEKWLPGFIGLHNGRQRITEHWMNKASVALAIDRAARNCPTDSIILETLDVL